MNRNATVLDTIALLTTAIAAHDSAADDITAARKAMIRQAVEEGHTLTAIGAASGITRQRVSQLAQDGANE